MEIFKRNIGPNYPVYFIAEIGANHDGDLDRALRLIELAADSGADAVKFQHFEARSIVSRRGFEELGKLAHQKGWDKSVYEVYETASIPLEWTEHLASYCHDHGMAFITTPYSLALADAVEPYVDAYKIGSGDVTYLDLIGHLAAKGKPLLLATGASDFAEVERAILRTSGSPLCVLQCNTDYTGSLAVLRYANLRVLEDWRRNWAGLDYGLSDHTPTPLTVYLAVALGACVIEKHFTDDPHREGPDHSFAITPFEWRAMVEDAESVRRAMGDGNKKVEENERDARIVQRRALRYVSTMPIGDVLHDCDVIATRPCPEGALEPYRITDVVGRTLTRDVEADALVEMEDFR